MSSLREVKDRIASVRSTLKITSAMKLVASSKLRKAQRAIEALRPYEETLSRILDEVSPSREQNISDAPIPQESAESSIPIIILACASNSSMCGAFNANVLKKTLEVAASLGGRAVPWAFGRKMAEGLRKAGIPAERDYSRLMGNPVFDEAAGIAAELRAAQAEGRIGGAVLVYNHFVSTGRQQVVVDDYLGDYGSYAVAQDDNATADDYILEPSRSELLDALMPQVLDLRLYAALLDSAAAEHAARMVAMQAATDNAEELLGELTLEYNKGRQQKITSELLDLLGGTAEQ